MMPIYRRVLTAAGALLFMTMVCSCPLGGGGRAPAYRAPTADELAKETDAFNRVNAHRAANSVAALILDSGLTTVARKHSQDMIGRGFFAHTNPSGQSPGDRVTAAGIAWTTCAENIQKNNFPNPSETAVTGWIASPGHNANMLNASLTRSGMGVAMDGSGMYYFTQVFIATTKGGSEGYVVEYYSEPLEIVR